MSSPWADICPLCKKPLPARGNKRARIPHLGGKTRLVHPGCAADVAKQLVIEDPSSGPWNRGALLKGRRT
jgi:hypothetical protein